MEYQNILNEIKKQYEKILMDNLVGIYVHGSIAFKCFNWDKSDIDFVVVINNKIDMNTKLQLLNCLETLRPQCPQKRLEMSVVLKEYCVHFQYPTPYELHFSNGWLNRYLTNPISMCGDKIKTDKDLAAHFTVIREVGRVLHGLPIEDVFGSVGKAYYLDSIKNEVSDAKNEVLENPIYIILNLCRVLAYIEDNFIVSKEQGGQWAIGKINKKYLPLVQSALNCYQTNAEVSVDNNLAVEFSEYMLNKIFNDN